jgi:hypothetical protein
MTLTTTRRKRLQLFASLLAGSLALTACTGKDEPKADPITYSTLGVASEVLCGFVPEADLVTALGSSALAATGSLVGRGGSQPLASADCMVKADERELPNFEVVVSSRGQDKGFTEWELKNPKPARTVFPTDHPTGFAEPAYQSRLEGTKMGELRTGALAVAIIGDWYINLRIYRPGKGRNAVTDSINLVQRIAASLQLPPQATRTYEPFTPSSRPTPTPSPSGTPSKWTSSNPAG